MSIASMSSVEEYELSNSRPPTPDVSLQNPAEQLRDPLANSSDDDDSVNVGRNERTNIQTQEIHVGPREIILAGSGGEMAIWNGTLPSSSTHQERQIVPEVIEISSDSESDEAIQATSQNQRIANIQNPPNVITISESEGELEIIPLEGHSSGEEADNEDVQVQPVQEAQVRELRRNRKRTINATLDEILGLEQDNQIYQQNDPTYDPAGPSTLPKQRKTLKYGNIRAKIEIERRFGLESDEETSSDN